jgi:hypothetical protein
VIARIIEVLDSGRVHVSIGDEQWRDVVVLYPVAMRISLAIGDILWVFDDTNTGTERYGLPVTLHRGAFSSGPGELAALQTQIDALNTNLKTHIHLSAAPGAPTGAALASDETPLPDPPDGSEKVRLE